MVADALDDRARARVAHREALTDESAKERTPARRAVEDRVAGDDVLFGAEARILGRPQCENATRESLPDVVVRIADERQVDAGREPRAERLAGGAAEHEADRSGRQSGGAVQTRDGV